MKSRNIVLLIGIIAVFVAGLFVGKTSVVCKYCPPEEVDMSLLWEAWDTLENTYVNPKEIDHKKLVHGAISGMVSSLQDPYTTFFTPEETTTFLEDVSGEFEGVGMEIGIREEQLQVVAPLEGTPAERAGLRPGDKIIKIDDKSTADIIIEEAVTLIRGPKGTEVTLGVIRDGWSEIKEFTVKRAVIKVPSMEWELKENNIAHIKLYHFSEKSDKDFGKLAYEIINSSADKIVLDLRNNPGGYLERAQDIAGWFLERDQVVVIEDFGNKREDEIYKAIGNSSFANYPLVVLINQGSASASEILASALRDNRNVKLIGETSFGKGSVQTLRQLTDGSSIKITLAKWLTPNGDQIMDRGLEPDIKVELTEEDWENKYDPQLDRAIEELK